MYINTSKMVKYIILGWPEIQKFMDHPRWDECKMIASDDIEYAIPEDLYDDVEYKSQFPKKDKSTNLGTVVWYEDKVIVNGDKVFWYDLSDLKKGNKVLVYNSENDKWVITQCVSAVKGFPILLEEDKLLDGMNCKIIGHYDPEIPF